MQWPLRKEDYFISQGFSSGHQGIDVAANSGTPIYAPEAGIVVGVNDNPSGYFGGKFIRIKGISGYQYYMGHNSKNYFKPGDAVSLGEHIADVGSTGQASGPHIHFEMIGKTNVDASKYLTVHPKGQGGDTVPITKEQENALSVLATGSYPGKNYSYPHVGKPNNQQNIDAILTQWLGYSETQPGGLIVGTKSLQSSNSMLLASVNDLNNQLKQKDQRIKDLEASRTGSFTEDDRKTITETNVLVKFVKDFLSRIFK